jgi:hypothetical protein
MQLNLKEKLGQLITDGKTNDEEIQAYIGILMYMELVDLPVFENYF